MLMNEYEWYELREIVIDEILSEYFDLPEEEEEGGF